MSIYEAVMLIGGVGWMAGPACIIPKQSVELYNLAACIKAGLAIQGYEVGDPVPPLTADERRAVEAVLREVG